MFCCYYDRVWLMWLGKSKSSSKSSRRTNVDQIDRSYDYYHPTSSSINSWNDITWSRISSESGCWEQKRHSSSRRGLNYFDPDLIEIHAPPSPSRSQRPCQRLSEAGDSFFRWEGRWRRTMRTIGRNCPTNTSRDDSVSLDDDAAITTKDALSLD